MTFIFTNDFPNHKHLVHKSQKDIYYRNFTPDFDLILVLFQARMAGTFLETKYMTKDFTENCPMPCILLYVSLERIIGDVFEKTNSKTDKSGNIKRKQHRGQKYLMALVAKFFKL